MPIILPIAFRFIHLFSGLTDSFHTCMVELLKAKQDNFIRRREPLLFLILFEALTVGWVNTFSHLGLGKRNSTGELIREATG